VGIPVTIVETAQEALDRGLGIIRKNYENTARKGRISEADVEQRCGLIQGSLELGDLADCDLVIEAVFENMEVKKDIFGRLDGIAKAGAILASNTSALDLNEIASATSRPESVIGLHFFSPANVMKLLEVVRGDKTSNPVIKTCMSFAKRIKKVPVLVGVCHGFVGNRILFARQAQANQVALEGAPYYQVDKVLYDFGFPMGAFQMGDLAGLDIGWNKETSKGETIKDRLCELGRLGQKSGSGFYDYDEKRTPKPSPMVMELFKEYSAKAGLQTREVSDDEILDRCVLPMINEGAKILEEGIALRASDIDVVYVYGYGWPVYRGGPMHYANSLGLDKVVEKLRHYQQLTGDDFWQPAPLLVSLAEKGKFFS
jgi:3-hydroxyacyl-CoA dehydrogenase